MQVNGITKAELEVAWPILQPAGGAPRPLCTGSTHQGATWQQQAVAAHHAHSPRTIPSC
jgi:hypothetical protein